MYMYIIPYAYGHSPGSCGCFRVYRVTVMYMALTICVSNCCERLILPCFKPKFPLLCRGRTQMCRTSTSSPHCTSPWNGRTYRLSGYGHCVCQSPYMYMYIYCMFLLSVVTHTVCQGMTNVCISGQLTADPPVHVCL